MSKVVLCRYNRHASLVEYIQSILRFCLGYEFLSSSEKCTFSLFMARSYEWNINFLRLTR